MCADSPTPNESSRILVVEDDVLARETLQALLTKEGWHVDTAGDGIEMRALLEENIPSIVLMDVHLPGEDGFELTRFLRDHHELGIIMLTAKSDLIDRVVGLEIGADDYVTKPYQPRELLARIKSLFRRLEVNAETEAITSANGTSSVPATQYRFSGCVLDGERRKLVGPNGELLNLTTSELSLLGALVQNPHAALSRVDLMQLVYHREWNSTDRSIDVLAAKVRRKLEGITGDASLVRSVRGVGYELAASVEEI
ncbi:MAG: response regulator transcription factor [Rhodospirillaceae bacterium]|jgi:DNA-binding response OmpR family regulator|nr:response regulator transcription factor [Rhodospirillaceae bacterium]MBT5242333.1 response regulator transcription factor [Rhodospirillaceae bacterium]MBT5564525.1 response regulator transcription factor [Rhodospirillaceae bacterium]MBT7450332.1 response regulator transcription factor [Rhodospirillaceae bacterium]